MLRIIEIFVFWYPAIMSAAWIVGAIIFYFSNERKPLPLYETPMVSILVPCYNEEETIEVTVAELSQLRYPNFEIIAINDGSSDKTSEVVQSLLPIYDRLRFIDCLKLLKQLLQIVLSIEFQFKSAFAFSLFTTSCLPVTSLSESFCFIQEVTFPFTNST